MNRASKLGKKNNPASEMLDPKAESKKKRSFRDPLKDLNSINSSSNSSSNSSLSIEARRGCLSFFLSNSSSKTPVRRLKTLPKTPKSAPNLRPSKPRSKYLTKQHPSSKSIFENPEKRILQNPPKAKKISSLYQWKNGRKYSSRAPQQPYPSPVLEKNGAGLNISATESCIEEDPVHQQRQKWSTRMIDDKVEPSELSSISFKAVFNENGTPLDSTPSKAMEENSTSSTTTTPPVQASISPEIQCGSSLVSTPACYAAGHIVSGVTDKRKCRPRGLLTVGDDIGSCKASFFGSVVDENAVDFLNNSSISLIPAPSEASLHWLLSPCDEEEEDQKGGNGFSEFKRLVSSTTFHSPSSPSSGHGFSSDVCKISGGTSSSSTITTTPPPTRTSLVSPCGLPEFEGLVASMSSVFQMGPSFDHMVGCSSSSSPITALSCKAVMAREAGGYRYNLTAENSPFSGDSVGSQNVICTPQSNSGSERRFGLSSLNAEDHQECEFDLESMVEALQMTNLSPRIRKSMWDPADVLPLQGFQFTNPTTPSNSIDQNQIIQDPLNDQASKFSTSTFENLSQSQMRISWREGLVSRIFEMDELDCCQWLSDEDEDAGSCGNDEIKSDFGRELDESIRNDPPLTNGFGSPEFVYEEPGIGRRSKVEPPQQSSSFADSISIDGGGLVASGDSDWNLCYKNHLFKV